MANIPREYYDLIAGRHKVVDVEVIDGITDFWIAKVADTNEISSKDTWQRLSAGEYFEWYETAFFEDLVNGFTPEQQLYKLAGAKYHLKSLINRHDVKKDATPIIEQLDNTTEFIEKSLLYSDANTINDTLSTENQKVSPEKIKWTGTPAQFGHIFRELADRGYIEEPKTRAKESNAAYARLLLQHFEVEGSNKTIEHELNPNQNSLTETRSFKIPDQKSL